VEDGEKAALAALNDGTQTLSMTVQAVGNLANVAKKSITDLFRENQSLHAAVRKAQLAESQANLAVAQAADRLRSLEQEVRTAQHAEKKDIVESLEKHRKDNALLQVRPVVPLFMHLLAL
jgi:DnaJ-domain-containing protein 1